MATLESKLIKQDIATLRQAYQLRKREYDTLRAAGEWAGAVLHAGVLLELALKIVICKHLDITRLPLAFKVHELDFLLYCSGLWNAFFNNKKLYRNFGIVQARWTMELRYQGAVITEKKSNEVHEALFDQSSGVLTFLSSFL
jgi:hypothetical protein